MLTETDAKIEAYSLVLRMINDIGCNDPLLALKLQARLHGLVAQE